MLPNAVILELLARGAAVGAFVGLAIVIARGRLTPARITGVLFCFAVGAHTLTQYQPIEDALRAVWPIVWAFSVASAGFMWAFAVELFEDRDKLSVARFAPAGVLFAIGVAAVVSGAPAERPLWLAHKLVGAAVVTHALFVIVHGWRGDLVESRRRLRGPILIVSAVYALAVTVVETGELFVGSAAALSPIAAAVLVLLSLLALAAFARADASLFGPASAAVAAPEQEGAPTIALSGEDAVAASALKKL
jgi:hypothetical protein